MDIDSGSHSFGGVRAVVDGSEYAKLHRRHQRRRPTETLGDVLQPDRINAFLAHPEPPIGSHPLP